MSKNILVMTVKIPMLISQEATVHTLNDDMALERLKGKLIEIVSSELKHSLDYRKARIDDSITLAKYLHNKTEQDVLDEMARVEQSHKEILQQLDKCKLKTGKHHFDAVFVEIGECELV